MEKETVNHETQESAMGAVQRALQEAQEDGHWMVAVWSVTENTLKLLTRTTWSFPVGDLLNASKQLQGSFSSELQAHPQVLRVMPMEPLPTARAFSVDGRSNGDGAES